MKLIHNGKIFSENQISHGYIIIEDGKITKIGKGSPKPKLIDKADEKFDCNEHYVFPGFIDTHVHFRDAEQAYKETFESGSRAALAGGVTTVLSMPNTKPPLSTVENITKYYNLLQEEALYCNVGIFSGIKEAFEPTEMENIAKMGVFGIKIYPGDKSVNLPLDWREGWKNDLTPSEFAECIDEICENFKADYDNWKRLFRLAKKYELPLLFHPELPQTDENLAKKMDIGLSIAQKERISNNYLFAHDVAHPIFSNELAFLEMIASLTRGFFKDPATCPHLHFVHISNLEAAQVIQEVFKKNHYRCSYEVTPHHLLLNYNIELPSQQLGKVLVPLRAPKQQKRLFDIVKLQQNDIFGTDHAPHTLEEKQKPFLEAPSGFPSIDFAPRILLSLAFQDKIPLEHIINAYATKPAEIFQIPRKGKIQEGYDADLVIVKKSEPYTLKREEMNGSQKWSPWENYTVEAQITQVFLGGNCVYNPQNGIFKAAGDLLKKRNSR